MRKPARIQLQLALDFLSTEEALRMVSIVHPYFDWAEIGTPLLLSEGLHALETIRALYPDKQYLADLKIMDAGNFEAAEAFQRGANIVTVLAVADDQTIKGVLKAAEKFHGLVMADLINVPNPRKRAKELEKLGVDIICLHTAHDLQSSGKDPLLEIKAIRQAVKCRLAVAGGLQLCNVAKAVRLGADVVIVGGGITRHSNPGLAASQIIRAIHKGI